MNAPRIALAASISVVLGLAGCKGGINGDTTTQETAQVQYPAQDPAGANVAPVSYASDNTGAPPGAYRYSRPRRTSNDSESEPRSQYSADEQDQDPYAEPYSSGDNYGDYSDYDTPVEYAPQPPPPLPDYAQPPAPGDDYMWTPGYWNYDNGEGYYWVPGAWVLAPYVGALWTPGWWGYDHERYGWHRGFWGRHIGYYGGINYGHGYEGRGYEGGYWRGDHFCYNRTVNNVNTTIVKNVYVYNLTKINNTYNNTHISYNGGRGGIVAQPRPREIAAYHEQHNAPMTAQLQMAHEAHSDRLNFVRFNNGRPQAPVVGHPLSADNNVRPPAILNYQAMRQQPNEPQRFVNRPQQNQPPVEFHNNVHPVPAGSHMAPENPPAPRAPYSVGGRMPQPPVAAPQESRRPVEQRPFAPERPVPMRPPVPQPQPMRPAPPPLRPAPQQRPEPQRPAPPPERRSESAHPAPPQHPAPNKRPEEHRMR